MDAGLGAGVRRAVQRVAHDVAGQRDLAVGDADGVAVDRRDLHDRVVEDGDVASGVGRVALEETGQVSGHQPAAPALVGQIQLAAFPNAAGLDAQGDNLFLSSIVALDAKSGKLLWRFYSGASINASPISYAIDGRQYVAVSAGAQVLKFSPTGKLLMRLGTAGVYGKDGAHFSQPSDVITAPNGDIFVAEGHSSRNTSNARVFKFDKSGKLLKTWGSWGKGATELDQPHALAFDSKGRLFVGDRGNDRILRFPAAAGVTPGVSAEIAIGQVDLVGTVTGLTASSGILPVCLCRHRCRLHQRRC